MSFLKGFIFGIKSAQRNVASLGAGYRLALYIALGSLSIGQPVLGQDFPPDGLFSKDQVLSIKLSGNIRELVKDRKDESQYKPFSLSYQEKDSTWISIPIEVKTRGHFRKTQGGCSYPPLLLNFSKQKDLKNTVFRHQNKLKLVTPCRDQKFVVREYLVYKLLNFITPKSFGARLVKVIYDDTVSGKKSTPLYGILLEEEDQMAKRNNAKLLEKKLVRPQQTQTDDFMNMAVFNFLIGNTDWSIQYLQNVKLITTETSEIPSAVPYDFDHAGIVEAPYAKPAEQLQLSTIRERRYRGYCMNDMKQFDKVFAHFNDLKEKIYGVYSNSGLLDESYIKSTSKYLDEFYKTINDPKMAKASFQYPCDPNGTGNIVIKGLSKE